MEEFYDLIDNCTNIETLNYDIDTKVWTITYKNGLEPSFVSKEILFEFLENA